MRLFTKILGSPACAGFLLACAPLVAQEAAPEVDAAHKVRGPFYSGSIRWRSTNDVIAYKGIALTLGAETNAWVCYDADLVRLSFGWVNDGGQFGLVTPRYSAPLPRGVGTPIFGNRKSMGWSKAGSFDDPREEQRGPLPKDWAHHKGLYVHGRQVVLNYTVGPVEMLELPGFERAGTVPVFTRVIQPLQPARDLALSLMFMPNARLTPIAGGCILHNTATGRATLLKVEGVRGATWELRQGTVVLKLPQLAADQPFRIAIAALGERPDAGKTPLVLSPPPVDLRVLTRGGPALWPEPVVTKGRRAPDTAAYVVDRITEPAPNPWNADTFFGGFDFFSDGRAAVCTMQGEVWVVSGIDDALGRLEWRRFAGGLFQGLGLRIVNDQVYVTGRDQITRLHDHNGDGEADFYENFNNDTILSRNPADYCLDLQTDGAGNFYFAKAAPWHPLTTTPHQGCLFRVSKDGSKMEIVATGLRAPNGMTIGPRDEIFVSDNQGHWMPASKLNRIRPGGFYGMVPTAQRELKLRWHGTNFTANPSDPRVREQHGFEGYGRGSPMPAGYDQPIAWLPMDMDNSSGGEVWATTDRWGPLNDKLLFTSYGKCSMFAVLMHEIAGGLQTAMVPLPLRFDTGIMRGRVNPKDGQVYVCGLRGWMTSAVRAGGLFRLRHTAKPAHLPVAFAATSSNLRITFSDPLDREQAEDGESYNVERWNYRYSGGYGSPHFSLTERGKVGQDELKVTAARLSADGKTVTLDVADLRPCHQLRLKFNLKGTGGERVRPEICATIPALEQATAELK